MNVLFVALLVSAALLSWSNVHSQIIFDTTNIANGEYSYKYSDGPYSKDETGKLDSDGNLLVSGQYRYVVDGKEYAVTYTADKDGYHPRFTISDDKTPPISRPPLFNNQLALSLLGK